MDSIEDLFQYFEDEVLSSKDIINDQKQMGRKRLKNRKKAGSWNKAKKFRNSSENNDSCVIESPIHVLDASMSDDPDKNDTANVSATHPIHDIDIIVETIMDEGCIHEVAYSSSQKLNKLSHYYDSPAKLYPFLLDPFQKQAILCIDKNQSVMVSAHTSAGKTAIAEYAIARSLKSKQRVIYTTPIKALSNQKYRELLTEFNDVGLMTGDVTIDGSASCIVMTTEILRSMLYKGSEVMKEVGWVIFDEIHYMRDKTRGVVWEETLILLPKNVRYVFLSATIPNARQFAEWICNLHKQPCNVVFTEHRPTPLQHYIYPSLGRKLQLVIDENGVLNEINFEAAMEMLQKNTPKPKQTGPDRGALYNLVTEIIERKWAPVIVFNFSKKDCEMHALNMADCNFNTDEEIAMVNEIYNNAISILQESERNLPHVMSIVPLLRKGIAFHHSGLLPIVKESIEILFGEGLIKVLYATETFSMGLNMPAKTVVFTNIKKFDGVNERYITSGEYIQMSGRAGRRGIDDKGIVIMLAQELLTSDTIKNILLGKADPLNSAFHLTDNMILNLLRQEEINPELIITQSFMQFQNNQKIRENSREIEKLQFKNKAINFTDESNVESYMDIKAKLSVLHDEIREIIVKPRHIRSFLQPGRLLKIKNNLHEYDWGILMPKNYKNITGNLYKPNSNLIKINVMLHTEIYNKDFCLPNPNSEKSDVYVFAMEHTLIYQICSEIVDVTPLLKAKKKKEFFKMMRQLKILYPNGFPLLHPILDMNISNPRVMTLINSINQNETLLTEHEFHKDKMRTRICKLYTKRQKLQEDINFFTEENAKLSFNSTFEELQKRKNVLRAMGYCDNADNISLKGRVACEFSANELLLNEMIFHGVLNKMPVNHCVALLSCLLCNEKDPELKSDSTMVEAISNVKVLIGKISRICYENKLLLDETDRTHEFQPNMVEVILSWCNGASFLDICNMTSIYEGSIIRYMRGIEEILKELYKAARNIGNIDLEVKFSEGIKRLKRGIVFAASLYL